MRSKYALMALEVLARSTDKETFLIAELADAGKIPKKFLEAILLSLKGNGILTSRKGPGGGYSLAMSPAKITIGSVIRAFEGDLAPVQCLSGKSSRCTECSSPDTCGIKLVLKDVQKALDSILEGVTLAEMIERSDFERQKLSEQPDYSI